MKAKRMVAVSDSLTPTSMPMTRDCVADIREIITRARRSVVRHVNTTMTLAYWLVGRRIVVEEQQGKRRAAYGEHLLERISRELTADFGNGFGEPQLRNCRLFYKAFPTEEEIRYTLCIKLSWSHLRLVMRVADPKARAYSIMSECERMFAVKLLPYMPTREELIFEIERSRGRISMKRAKKRRS